MLRAQSLVQPGSGPRSTHMNPVDHNNQSLNVDDQGDDEALVATPQRSPAITDEEQAVTNTILDNDNSNPSAEPKRTLGPTTVILFLHSWILEIGALAMSVLCFLTSMVVMGWSDNKPLSNWNAHFSINTVISILTTISRMTLAFAMSACLSQQKWNSISDRSEKLQIFQTFDEASRGPWGGLLLMLRLRSRPFAALGGLSTVLFVAFDPFLQNAVGFESQRIDLMSSASSLTKVLRLDVGEPGYGAPWSSLERNSSSPEAIPHPMWSTNNLPDAGLTIAVTQGFSNLTESRSTIPATCETGNCVWPKYSSLGICSSCFDVSTRIVRKRHLNLNNPDLYYHDNVNGPSGNTDADSDCILSLKDGGLFNCYTLSADGESVYDESNNTISTNPDNEPMIYNMKYLLPSVGFTNRENALFNATGDIIVVANATSEPEETFNFKDSTTLIFAFTSIKASNSFLQNKTTWNDSIPVATECALFFCINEYNVSMTNGTLDQAIKPLPFDRNPASFGNSTDPTFLNRSLQVSLENVDEDDIATAAMVVKAWYTNDALWRRDGSIVTMLEPYSSYDLQIITKDTEGSTDRFNISANTASSLIQYILSWSVGQTPYIHDESDVRVIDSRPNNFVSRTLTNATSTSSSFIDMIYSSSNLSLTFANTAHALSTYIQNIKASGGTAPVSGISRSFVTHIKIQWEFVVVPAITILAGHLYVFLTLWQTWRLRTPIIKEALVPLLSRGLDEDDRRRLQDAEESSGLRNDLRTSRVQLDGVLRLTAGS